MVLLAIVVAALLVGTTADVSEPEAKITSVGPVKTVAKPRCKSARLALVYYRTNTWKWQTKRTFSWQSDRRLAGPGPLARGRSCEFVRRGVDVWRARAREARIRYEKWFDYHYNWRKWLPSVWYRIGSCETGYGGDPNWRHLNGEFEGAFGNRGPGRSTGAWLGHVGRADPKAGPYPAYAHMATPRQQYEHALVLYSLYGWSPWGCA
jgi:hypothetical protein